MSIEKLISYINSRITKSFNISLDDINQARNSINFPITDNSHLFLQAITVLRTNGKSLKQLKNPSPQILYFALRNLSEVTVRENLQNPNTNLDEIKGLLQLSPSKVYEQDNSFIEPFLAVSGSLYLLHDNGQDLSLLAALSEKPHYNTFHNHLENDLIRLYNLKVAPGKPNPRLDEEISKLFLRLKISHL